MTRPAVLVTGGARRIGAAISRRFGEAGWHVLVHCRRSAEAAEALARELPSAEVVQCDFADGDATAAMVRELAGRQREWRCLVNSAAVFAPDSATDLDPATNAEAMAINAAAPLRLAQLFLAQAQSSAGRRVIQLTDQKLANPNPDFLSYTMSKAAVDCGSQLLAMAARGNDRVYRLAPGAILASHDQSEAEAEVSHRMNLLGRRTTAREVADAALFLAEGPLTNGQQLFVDSGQHLLSQPRDVIYLARQGESDT